MEIGGSESLQNARKPLSGVGGKDSNNGTSSSKEWKGNVDFEYGGKRPELAGRTDRPDRAEIRGRGGSSSSSSVQLLTLRAYNPPTANIGFSAKTRVSTKDLSHHHAPLPIRVQGTGRTGRVSSPIRTTAEARRRLQESLNADGQAKACCMGAALDLERLADSINPKPLLTQQSGGTPERERSKPSLGADANPEVVRKFGLGKELVLQLKLFGDKDLFAFRYGCMVCWNFTALEYSAVKERLRPFVYKPEQHHEEESMEFVIKRRSVDENDSNGRCGEDQTGSDPEDSEERENKEYPGSVKNDQIILFSADSLERLAHSCALAQSVRLAVFEIVVDRSIALTRSIPETMALTGEVVADPNEIAKQMGQLLMLRCDVNLHTDILDTPDIFWDEERFEPHYGENREYLEIDKRVEILNQRLIVLKDLYDLLQNGLNVKHGNKLEWIIIILILVEVVLELLELVHDAFAH